MKKLLITTPIYYVNDKPHLGHAYTTLMADILTRFYKKQNRDVFFLTGTDEHGTKVFEAAKKQNKEPQEFCDQNSKLFKDLWKNLNIEYTYFIRTTDKRHEKGVEKFLTKLKENNAVYEKEYKGLYCTGCEKFLTKKELINGLCPDHKKEPKEISEKNYFFKLTNYLDQIKKIIETDALKIQPQRAKKETLGLLRQGLEDFSISRQKVKWGIPLPFDKKQTIYVWTEALLNYITAIGYGDDPDQFKKWWTESEKIHLLAKDILKFHDIYWPAMLLAAEEVIPNKEFVHGFFTVNNEKMSKTLGNVIDPNNIVKEFGVDSARYLLLSQFPSDQDGDIKEEQFKEKYNTDLANGLGNLVSRVINLADKNNIKKEKPEKEIEEKTKEAKEKYANLMENFKLYESIEETWKLIKFCDSYTDKTKPWEIKEKEKQTKILSNLLYLISEIAELIQPFMPQTAEEIKKQLKENKAKPLFPRI
ncbi:MAG: methionine--tRNA ligase [Candidatus Portnoybacteria bacterium]|nr:methionine--tRNA ligase [Candidatus Portnoybacteria bacterium]